MSGDNVPPRDLFVFRAKLASTAGLYDDMVSYIREAAKYMSGGPTIEECELLYTAFRRAVTERRAALRVIQGLDTPGNSQLNMNQDYHNMIVGELQALCADALQLAQSLLKTTTDPDMKVLLNKMIGDHHRYKCEVPSKAKDASLRAADDAYNQAMTLAETELTATHPLRLEVGLCYLVLLMDHLNHPDKARNLAASLVDLKYDVTNSLIETAYRDSALIMQLVEDRFMTLKHMAEKPKSGDVVASPLRV